MAGENSFDDKPESEVIVDYVFNRFLKGMYSLTLVIGLPGTGKSSTCMRLDELTNKKINEWRIRQGKKERHNVIVIDSLLALVSWLRDAQPGDGCIIEEMSVLFPSRRAMAADNVSIGRVLDTCRKKQVILWANAPILNSIDSHIRAMAHISLETLKIYKTQGVVISKPHRLQTNPGSGKTYKHKFTRDGREVDLTYTRMPDSDRWAEYEKQKDDFMDELYESLEAKAIKAKEKNMKERGLGVDGKPKEAKVDDIDKRLIELIAWEKKQQKEAAAIVGISPAAVCVRMRKLKKNGILKN